MWHGYLALKLNSAIGLTKLNEAKNIMLTLGLYPALDDNFEKIEYSINPCYITHCRISNNKDIIIIEATLNNAPTWEQIKTKLSNKLGYNKEQIETNTAEYRIFDDAVWVASRDKILGYINNNISEFVE